MQPLLDPPRDGLTEDQVRALLTTRTPHVGYGVELLDGDLRLVTDWGSKAAGVVQDGTVHRDCTQAVAGSVDLTLTLSEPLAWGKDLVRPYMLLSDASVDDGPTARFNLGVYCLTTPDLVTGQSTPTYPVTGHDLLYWLQPPITDTQSVSAGDNGIAAIQRVLETAGWTAPVLLNTIAASASFPADRVWSLFDSPEPTSLSVLTDMLAALGYGAPWTDWNGAFRAGPIVPPTQRPSEYTFTVNDRLRSVIAPGSTVTQDLWNLPNRWRFVQNGVDSPVIGAGLYIVNNLDNGPSAQNEIGRIIPAPVQALDAVSQDAFVAQGNAIAAAAQRVAKVFKATFTNPFPILWHEDISVWDDDTVPGGAATVMGQAWDIPLSGGKSTYQIATVA